MWLSRLTPNHSSIGTDRNTGPVTATAGEISRAAAVSIFGNSLRRKVGLGLSILAVFADLAEPGPAAGQSTVSDSARVHVVDSGDTLWDLAGRYLSDPFLWPRIYEANRDAVRDPHRIYPQDRLRIPGVIGSRAAVDSDTEPPEVVIGQESEASTPAPFTPTVFARQGAVAESVEGGAPASRPSQVLEEYPVVPSGSFYAAGLLVPDAELGEVGRLFDIESPTVIPRRARPQIQVYDRVYVRVSGRVARGDRLHFMRAGRMIAPYGRVFTATGSGLVLDLADGTAVVEVDRMFSRMELEDLALRQPAFAVPAGVVPVAAGGLSGEVLALEAPQPVAGTEDRVFLNVGSASGVAEGDEFEVFIPATLSADGVRPEVIVGRVQVVRVARLTSTARIRSLRYPALEAGLPVRLVARMP